MYQGHLREPGTQRLVVRKSNTPHPFVIISVARLLCVPPQDRFAVSYGGLQRGWKHTAPCKPSLLLPSSPSSHCTAFPFEPCFSLSWNWRRAGRRQWGDLALGSAWTRREVLGCTGTLQQDFDPFLSLALPEIFRSPSDGSQMCPRCLCLAERSARVRLCSGAAGRALLTAVLPCSPPACMGQAQTGRDTGGHRGPQPYPVHTLARALTCPWHGEHPSACVCTGFGHPETSSGSLQDIILGVGRSCMGCPAAASPSRGV